MQNITFVRLSSDFFEKHAEDSEIEQKETRKHLEGAILSDEDNTYFTPLRSNLNQLEQYPELYVHLPLPNKPKAGLDLRKTVVISNNEVDDFVVKGFFKVPKIQLEELKKVDFISKLERYLEDYKLNYKDKKYQFSTFQYFHKELGIKKEKNLFTDNQKVLNDFATSLVGVHTVITEDERLAFSLEIEDFTEDLNYWELSIYETKDLTLVGYLGSGLNFDEDFASKFKTSFEFLNESYKSSNSLEEFSKSLYSYEEVNELKEKLTDSIVKESDLHL